MLSTAKLKYDSSGCVMQCIHTHTQNTYKPFIMSLFDMFFGGLDFKNHQFSLPVAFSFSPLRSKKKKTFFTSQTSLN